MTKFIRSAAAASVLSLSASPALAATATPQASVSANIRIPVTLSRVQDLNFGDIVLSGAGPFTATVSVSQSGERTCPAAVTCSGTAQQAIYNVRGSNNQVVRINAQNFSISNGTTSLPVTVSAPSSLTLANSGAPGSNFGVGASINVSDTTPDGLYTGTFIVTADYQ